MPKGGAAAPPFAFQYVHLALRRPRRKRAPPVLLHVGELPILWNSGGQHYNPDFIVIDADATHWVVEVRSTGTPREESRGSAAQRHRL